MDVKRVTLHQNQTEKKRDFIKDIHLQWWMKGQRIFLSASTDLIYYSSHLVPSFSCDDNPAHFSGLCERLLWQGPVDWNWWYNEWTSARWGLQWIKGSSNHQSDVLSPIGFIQTFSVWIIQRPTTTCPSSWSTLPLYSWQEVRTVYLGHFEDVENDLEDV